MGSTDSLENIFNSANAQDFESISSGCSGFELKSSSSSAEVELNKENLQHQEQPAKPKKSLRTSSQVGVSEESLREREKVNNINDLGEKRSIGALSGNKQALPREGGKKIASGDKRKKDGQSPRFKRKVSCVSSSQPICGNDFDSGTTTNWKIEYKKQAQSAKRMRLRAERAEKKLKLVRSQLKKVYDILIK